MGLLEEILGALQYRDEMAEATRLREQAGVTYDPNKGPLTQPGGLGGALEAAGWTGTMPGTITPTQTTLPQADSNGEPLTPMAQKIIAERLGINVGEPSPTSVPIDPSKFKGLPLPGAQTTPTAPITPSPSIPREQPEVDMEIKIPPERRADAEARLTYLMKIEGIGANEALQRLKDEGYENPVAPTTTVGQSGAPLLKTETPPPFEPPAPPTEVDFKKEITNILSKIPETAEGVVGRPRLDSRAEFAKLPWYERLARGFVMTGQRRDFDNELDRVQKDINDRFTQDFEVAKSKLNQKTQMELKILEIQMGKEKEAKEGYAKMWAALGEANPQRFMNDPNWWKMGMRAYGMSEPALREWVSKQYDPTTGKTNLYMAKWEQEMRSRQSMANEIARMFPGLLSKKDLDTMVVTGQAPKWLGDRKLELEREYETATPTRKNQIGKTLRDLENMKNYMGSDQLAMLEKIKGQLDPETYQDLKALALAGITFGPHMMDTWAKYLESKRLAAATAAANKSQRAPSPAEITQFNVSQTLATPYGRVLVTKDPSYQMMGGQKEVIDRYSKDYTYYKDLMDRAEASVNPKLKGKPLTKEEKAALSQYGMWQKQTLIQGGAAKIVEQIPDMDYFEAQKAIELAMRTPPIPIDTIIATIKGSRK